MQISAQDKTDRPPRRWARWYGFLGAPIAWTLHLLGAYGIAEFGCVGLGESPRHWGLSLVAWMLLGLTGVLVLAAGGALVVAGWNWRKVGDGEQRSESGVTEEYLMRSGTYLGVIFLLIILVQAIPIFYYLEGC